jgi:membrane-associated phospholipid phosphatase
MRCFIRVRMIIVLSVVFISVSGDGQSNIQPDSLPASHIPYTAGSYQPKQVTYKSFILPASLITAGALGATGNFIISDTKIKEARDRNFPNFHTTVDNYLQYVPIAAGYAMLINNKQHNFWHYTEKVAVTEVIATGLAQSVKHIVKRPRPDTGEPTSFPSGHTTQAFAGATVFCDEFAQQNTWLAISAYTSATAVGALRILNDRHWASDVIAGAGFGILSAKLSELIIEPHGNKNHLSNNSQL